MQIYKRVVGMNTLAEALEANSRHTQAHGNADMVAAHMLKNHPKVVDALALAVDKANNIISEVSTSDCDETNKIMMVETFSTAFDDGTHWQT